MWNISTTLSQLLVDDFSLHLSRGIKDVILSFWQKVLLAYMSEVDSSTKDLSPFAISYSHGASMTNEMAVSSNLYVFLRSITYGNNLSHGG